MDRDHIYKIGHLNPFFRSEFLGSVFREERTSSWRIQPAVCREWRHSSFVGVECGLLYFGIEICKTLASYFQITHILKNILKQNYFKFKACFNLFVAVKTTICISRKSLEITSKFENVHRTNSLLVLVKLNVLPIILDAFGVRHWVAEPVSSSVVDVFQLQMVAQEILVLWSSQSQCPMGSSQSVEVSLSKTIWKLNVIVYWHVYWLYCIVILSYNLSQPDS